MRIANSNYVQRKAAADAGLRLSFDLCKAARITYRQLDHWVRRGYVRAYVPSEGSGTSRAFTEMEFQVATALGRLSEIGVLVGSPLANAVAEAIRNGETDGSYFEGNIAILWNVG